MADQIEDVRAKYEKSQVFRNKGNEHFKGGRYKEALREYYFVLLHTKGLDSNMRGSLGLPPSNTNNEKVKGKGMEGDAADKSDEAIKSESADLTEKVKKSIGLTYSNMAACHLKLGNWKKALENAQTAQTKDENNLKARFREAQARKRLGEINQARSILEDLARKNPDDAAVRAELHAMNVEEKQSVKKHADSVRGFFNKPSATLSPSPAPSTPSLSSSSSTPTTTNLSNSTASIPSPSPAATATEPEAEDPTREVPRAEF